VKRKAYSLNVEKSADAPVRFVTVLYPASDATAPQISASFTGNWSLERMGVDVTIDGKTWNLINSNLTK
jgi:heparan-sulfate lyase